MTRTAATTTEQNVVERQLAIESSLATTKQLQSIVVRAQITNIAALLPRNYFHRCSLSLWVCVRVSGQLSVQWQQKELTAKQNRQRKRERKRVSKAAASNRCTSRK